MIAVGVSMGGCHASLEPSDTPTFNQAVSALGGYAKYLLYLTPFAPPPPALARSTRFMPASITLSSQENGAPMTYSVKILGSPGFHTSMPVKLGVRKLTDSELEGRQVIYSAQHPQVPSSAARPTSSVRPSSVVFSPPSISPLAAYSIEILESSGASMSMPVEIGVRKLTGPDHDRSTVIYSAQEPETFSPPPPTSPPSFERSSPPPQISAPYYYPESSPAQPFEYPCERSSIIPDYRQDTPNVVIQYALRFSTTFWPLVVTVFLAGLWSRRTKVVHEKILRLWKSEVIRLQTFHNWVNESLGPQICELAKKYKECMRDSRALIQYAVEVYNEKQALKEKVISLKDASNKTVHELECANVALKEKDDYLAIMEPKLKLQEEQWGLVKNVAPHVRSLGLEVAALKKEKDERIAQQLAQEDELLLTEAKLESAITALAALDCKHERSKLSNSAYVKKILKLEDDIEALRSSKSELEINVIAARNDLDVVKTENTVLLSTMAKNEQRIEEIEAEKAELQERVTNLEAKNTALEENLEKDGTLKTTPAMLASLESMKILKNILRQVQMKGQQVNVQRLLEALGCEEDIDMNDEAIKGCPEPAEEFASQPEGRNAAVVVENVHEDPPPEKTTLEGAQHGDIDTTHTEVLQEKVSKEKAPSEDRSSEERSLMLPEELSSEEKQKLKELSPKQLCHKEVLPEARELSIPSQATSPSNISPAAITILNSLPSKPPPISKILTRLPICFPQRPPAPVPQHVTRQASGPQSNVAKPPSSPQLSGAAPSFIPRVRPRGTVPPLLPGHQAFRVVQKEQQAGKYQKRQQDLVEASVSLMGGAESAPSDSLAPLPIIGDSNPLAASHVPLMPSTFSRQGTTSTGSNHYQPLPSLFGTMTAASTTPGPFTAPIFGRPAASPPVSLPLAIPGSFNFGSASSPSPTHVSSPNSMPFQFAAQDASTMDSTPGARDPTWQFGVPRTVFSEFTTRFGLQHSK